MLQVQDASAEEVHDLREVVATFLQEPLRLRLIAATCSGERLDFIGRFFSRAGQHGGSTDRELDGMSPFGEIS